MSYPTLTPEQVLEALPELAENLKANEVLAVRGDDYKPKEKFRPSRQHVDNSLTGKRLPGVSAILLIEDTPSGPRWLFDEGYLPIGKPKYYGQEVTTQTYGNRAFLLTGYKYEMGSDEWCHEVIVSNHNILCEIDLSSL